MTTRIDQFSSPAAVGGGSGTNQVNVWIVGDDEEVIVIDPGAIRPAFSTPWATGRSSR